MKYILLVFLFFSLFWIYSFTPYFGSYFSFEVGELLKESNPFLDRNIVIFGASDGIKVSDVFSVNIQLLFSFPDEWYSYFNFKAYSTFCLLDIKQFVDINLLLNYGFDITTHFVKVLVSQTNDFLFRYYGIYMPFFSSSLTVGFDEFFVGIFGGIGWFGGMPVLFLSNSEPEWGLPVGYPLYYVGLKKIGLIDELLFYCDPNLYLLSLTRRF
ncbi:MAG: hypothetical protein N2712_07480 [Brevinematales bacterium]|nr:hypothetical protein [Brevinematales bacterium]